MLELTLMGLIFRDANGMVYLSDNGFIYCQHYSTEIDAYDDFWGTFSNDKPAAS